MRHLRWFVPTSWWSCGRDSEGFLQPSASLRSRIWFATHGAQWGHEIVTPTCPSEWVAMSRTALGMELHAINMEERRG